jgi:hypothetical protein
MRLFPLVVAFLLGASLSARAQEIPDNAQRIWSIELGTGIVPFHTFFTPSQVTKEELAQQGQAVGEIVSPYYPAFNLSGVYRFRRWTDFRFTVGASWRYYEVTQYSVFGTTPDGKPRYNLKNGSPAGVKNTDPTLSFTLQCFHVWNPGKSVELYSGGGLGLVIDYHRILTGSVFPFPDATPIGARFAGNHLYGFLELTFGPIASLIHGGLGWRF